MNNNQEGNINHNIDPKSLNLAAMVFKTVCVCIYQYVINMLKDLREKMAQ